MNRMFRCLFFFQAEDGIRDLTVTGVQRCALPIYRSRLLEPAGDFRGGWLSGAVRAHDRLQTGAARHRLRPLPPLDQGGGVARHRRFGVRTGGSAFLGGRLPWAACPPPDPPMRPQSTTLMKRAGFCLLGGLALATLIGCQSARGPRFDARAASAAKLSALTNFTTVAETNLLSLEWLKPPTNRFTLGPGDYLEIEIMGDTLTRATNFVAPDGRIYYYLLPGLDV